MERILVDRYALNESPPTRNVEHGYSTRSTYCFFDCWQCKTLGPIHTVTKDIREEEALGLSPATANQTPCR
jgi:hypothetical protein